MASEEEAKDEEMKWVSEFTMLDFSYARMTKNKNDWRNTVEVKYSLLRPLHEKIVCHQARQKAHKEGVYME